MNKITKRPIRGCGTFFFPPIWVGKKIDFHHSFTFGDPKLRSIFEKYSEIVFHADYEELKILVCRDGFIGIGMTGPRNSNISFRIEERRQFQEMLQVIMGIALLLGHTFFSVRLHDIFNFTKEINKEKVYGLGYTRKTPPHGIRDLLYHERYSGESILFHSMSRTDTLKIESIKTIIETSKKYFNNKEIKDDLITLLEAYTHYFYDEFNQSFTLSWNIIESTISEKWGELIDLSKIPITTTKRKDLKKSPMWYASHKSVSLFLSEKISSGDFIIVDDLRGKRNDYLHRNKKIREKDALRCFDFAKTIIKEKLGID